MPNIEASKSDLEKLAGKKFSDSELEEALLYVKGEIDSREGDCLKIDIKETNRPDLWSTEGIARELRSHFGLEKGIPFPEVKPAKVTVTIGAGLEKIRPLGVYAICRGVKVTDESLRQLIQLQEKICLTFGRKRKEVAIGVFDADKVKGNCRYLAMDPGFEFIPLGYSRQMSLREILYEHPKGKEYAHLLEGREKFPLLLDENNGVLSMPPIINSEGSGKVTEATKNLFIDVTGFRQENIETALRIICLALSDRGATIEAVQVKRAGKTITTPSFG
ncbi:MAG: phenylalanine--tRNA ligase beta subunit-related protein, partial [archaeon]